MNLPREMRFAEVYDHARAAFLRALEQGDDLTRVRTYLIAETGGPVAAIDSALTQARTAASADG